MIRIRPICRIACLALASSLLAGCVVDDGYGYRWHPHHYYYR